MSYDKATKAELERRDNFNRGYLIAISNLISMHGSEVEAQDLAGEIGLT